jgi:hypothetical protein
MAICRDIVDSMLAELRTLQQQDHVSWKEQVTAVKTKLAKYDDKQRRLTGVYVDGTMITSEFREAKAKLLAERHSSAEKLKFLEQNQKTRFEPSIRFIRGLTKPSEVAASGDPVSLRDFLKKTGSNLRVMNGRLKWEGRGPWNYVMASGFSTLRAGAAPRLGAAENPAVHDCPTWGPDRSAARMLLGQIQAFFEENPLWE